MGSQAGTAQAAASADFSRVDQLKKLPYKSATLKLADIKRAVSAVIRERSVGKDSK
jgi:hypothetical protein